MGNKNIKYNLTFAITFIGAMLFTTCNNITNTPEIDTPIETGYGRVSINFMREGSLQQTARTIFPSINFTQYEYTFIRAGETEGLIEIPDDDGFFVLEVGNYIVEVQAFIGDEESYTLAATGVSSEFSVDPGENDPVVVYLSVVDIVDENKGIFIYTITYPDGAFTEIMLLKWTDTYEEVALDPTGVGEGNGITETLQLEAGSYLLTVLVSKDGLYAGVSEAIHINPLLTTVYTKDFEDKDMLVIRIPLTSDYDISGTGTFVYSSGTARTVTITPKANVSPGEITIRYNGSTTAPTNTGTYTVTFDVAAAAPEWGAVTGLPAGTITINNPTPVASDYTITGAGTFTYNGNGRTVTITPKEGVSSGAITIRYNNSTSLPVNVGTYTVTFDIAAATGWNAATGLSAGTITIDKATGTIVDAPTLNARTANSIIINAVTPPSNGQTVEYARTTSTTAPTSGWQTSTSFTGLSASTTYYIWARSVENTNYNAGSASTSARLTVTTLHTYTVTANGSSSVKTTTLTFTFSSNPGTISTSNITLSGNAAIGSATVSGSGNSITLSPITLTGTGTTGTVTVSISHSDVETGSKTVTVYNPITAGLYNKAPPISGNDTPINIESASGYNIVDKAFNYINEDMGRPGTYTLILDSDISIVGETSDAILDGTANRQLKTANTKLTINGLDTERKIIMTSGNIMFGVGGKSVLTGIELTLGENIVLEVENNLYTTDFLVYVQNGASFIMKNNTSVPGNTHSSGVTVRGGGTFTMLDNAKVNSQNSGLSISNAGSAFTMSGNALMTGGIRYSSNGGGSITMSDNASLTGGIYGYNHTINMQGNAAIAGTVDLSNNSTFIMQNYATVSGGNNSNYGVVVNSNSTFTMQNNTKVSGFYNRGVYLNGTGTFTMSGNSSVQGNNGGGVSLYYNGNNFIMRDNASVSNNATTSNGGGVYVAYGSTFAMQDNASVSGNSGGNGGGVYIEGASYYNDTTFTMQGNASVSGNTATDTGGGGGVYVGNDSTFDMKGGTISGNKATNNTSNGGGVYVNGTFTMSGGMIYGTNATPATLSNISSNGAALYVTYSGTAKNSSGGDITNSGSGIDSNVSGGGTVGSVIINYNINGGTGTTPASQTVSLGSSITLPSSSGLSRTGYTFTGWNTSASGTGTNYDASSSYTVIGNITLYAQWGIMLTANTWAEGNITSTSGDQITYLFSVTNGTTYRIWWNDSHEGDYTKTLDVRVRASYSNGIPIFENKDSGWNTAESFTAISTGTVNVMVEPWYSGNTGTFGIVYSTSSTRPNP